MNPSDFEDEFENETPFEYTEIDILEEPATWDVDDFDDIVDFGTAGLV